MKKFTKEKILDIVVCVGSCCYTKGAQKIVDFIQEQMRQDDNLNSKITLAGAFCLGACGQGISILVDNEFRQVKDIDEVNQILQTLRES